MTRARDLQISLTLSTSAGQLTAVVTRIGAALRKFSIGAIDLVEPSDFDSLSPFCEGVIMAPWPNRIDGGKWDYQGSSLDLPINLHEQQNANHGLLMDHHYEVLEQNEASVTLGGLIHPRLGYPFEVFTTVKYELVEAGLKISHTAENRSAEDAPFALGAHPYFQISGVDTAELILRSDARTVTQVNDRQIPTGSKPVADAGFDLSGGVKIKEKFLDNNFTDLLFDENGLAHTYLTAEDGRGFDVWQDRHFKHVVLFTPDFYWTNKDPARRFACAIEPSTAGPNAFNTAEDLIWLKRGEIFSATWGINLLTK